MEPITKAFVSLSGGVDSSTCLAIAVDKLGNSNVEAISFDYGQRHAVEMQRAAEICNYFDVPFLVLEIPDMPRVMLTDDQAEVPNISYADIKGVSPTYVPFRNGLLISRLAGYAAHNIGGLRQLVSRDDIFGEVYFGAHADDAAGDAYPDCRLDFIGAMGAAVYIGTYHMIRLRAPLIEATKDQVIKMGNELKNPVPWGLTWSCYRGGVRHCGVCPTCRARREGFAKAGISDPTMYGAAA